MSVRFGMRRAHDTSTRHEAVHRVGHDRSRVDGAKLNALAASFRVDPIERMELQFFNGLLRIAGSIRKFISVPFTVDIREIQPIGHTVRVPIASASAFGALPIPQFLFGIVRNRLPAISSATKTRPHSSFRWTLFAIVHRCRHPENLDHRRRSGGDPRRGGADLPPSSEEINGRNS